MKAWKSHWPLVAALTLYALVVAALVAVDMRRNGGQYVYALDDAYIHLAIAKNLHENHIWGPTAYNFSSSSSSILWSLLLASSAALNLPLERMPLALNFAFACALLSFVYFSLVRRGASARVKLGALLVVCFVAPLPALTLSGMEHVMHCFFALAFLELASREWGRAPGGASSAGTRWLLVLGPLSVAARYEAVFLVATVCAFLMFERRRPVLAVAVGALSLAPIVAFGVYSLSKGSTFIANSVLAKGNTPGPSISSLVTVLRKSTRALAGSPEVLLLIVVVLALLAWRGPLSDRTRFSLKTLFLVTLAHLLLARLGSFYRYEAYLFVLFVATVAGAIAEASDVPFTGNPRWSALLAAFGAYPLLLRAGLSLAQTPGAAHEIYTQQYQMARFVHRYYPGSVVAANDIGAICYQTDARIVDLEGLATLAVLEAKRKGVYDTAKIDAITRDNGVQLALVYDSWYAGVGGLPASWKRVAQWQVSTMIVLGDTSVSIYAVDPAEAPRLAERVAEFSKELPPGVVVKGPASL